MSSTAGTVASDRRDNVRPFGWRDKVGYMFGDFGNDFTFILNAFFFSVFYVKVVGIDPVHVGWLLVAARIVDAFTDVGMGRILDLSKGTKAGKFRPWIMRGAIPVSLAAVLMFQSFIVGWESYGARVAWMVFTYFLWGSICYTLINIPYGSMASVMSDDPKDRAQLSVWRSTGANLAVLLLSVALPQLVYVNVNGQSTMDGGRMTMAAIYCGIGAVICYAICYFLVRERVVVAPKAKEDRQTGGQLVQSLFTNRSLIGIVLAALMLVFGNLLISGMLPYIMLDYFNDGKLQSTVQTVALVPTFLLIFIAPWLARSFGKREAGGAAMLIGGAILIVMSFMNLQGQTTLFIVLYGISQFAIAVFNFLIWAFITDVIDAQEVKTYERSDGTVYAVYSWARKLGQAIAGGLSNWALGWVGYQTAQGGAPITQTQDVLEGLWMWFTLVPGILLIIVAVLLFTVYPLSKRKVEENAEILRQRREATPDLVQDV